MAQATTRPSNSCTSNPSPWAKLKTTFGSAPVLAASDIHSEKVVLRMYKHSKRGMTSYEIGWLALEGLHDASDRCTTHWTSGERFGAGHAGAYLLGSDGREEPEKKSLQNEGDTAGEKRLGKKKETNKELSYVSTLQDYAIAWFLEANLAHSLLFFFFLLGWLHLTFFSAAFPTAFSMKLVAPFGSEVQNYDGEVLVESDGSSDARNTISSFLPQVAPTAVWRRNNARTDSKEEQG